MIRKFNFHNKFHKVNLEIHYTLHRRYDRPFIDIDLNSCLEFLEISFKPKLYHKKNGSWNLIDGSNDELRTKITSIFSNNPNVYSLCCIWKRWEGHGLRIGNRNQENYLRDKPNLKIKSIEEIYEELKKVDLHDDYGYHYGTSKLIEKLTPEVKRKIKKLEQKLTNFQRE